MFTGSESRLANAHNAQPHFYPWVATILNVELSSDLEVQHPRCAGALISSQHVLTTSLCVLKPYVMMKVLIYYLNLLISKFLK